MDVVTLALAKSNSSKVSVSETGTSTNEVKYITVDGSEYKIPVGGAYTNMTNMGGQSLYLYDMDYGSYVLTGTGNWWTCYLYYDSGHYLSVTANVGYPVTLIISPDVESKSNRCYEVFWDSGSGISHAYGTAQKSSGFGNYKKDNESNLTGFEAYKIIKSVNGSPNIGYTSTRCNIYVPTTKGTSGQFLKSNGNSAPTWTDAPKVYMHEIKMGNTYIYIMTTYSTALTGKSLLSTSTLFWQNIVNVTSYYDGTSRYTVIGFDPDYANASPSTLTIKYLDSSNAIQTATFSGTVDGDYVY